ncbi:VCBS repeat-containing protein [Aquimarina sp. U1-2]|uniref:VCBS repeat-containing protein n=1 Tax=Aquimarina sp. U1-2 TaxID=2823141 RepID=UPI001AECAE46|nr:VCBS repeat-containing protein [Aquimarina sp. U1-2]MBP2833006.1 VCBS repeat-containing protein [Aquimarina sp. U1-2]
MNIIKSLLFIVLLCFGCNKKEKNDQKSTQSNHQPLFEKLPSTYTKVNFSNHINETLYFNFLNYSYIYNGGGVAVGDINNDGLEDLYFSSNQNSNALYLNKGNFVFEDMTKKANVTDDSGWTTGVSMVDINADGWLDLYVCKSGSLNDDEARRNKLYINQKDGTFLEQAKTYGLDSNAYSTQAYYFDFDKDGDVDIYLVNHRADFNNNVTIDPKIRFDFQKESTDQLFENVDGTFTDITKTSGILNKAWGLSASIGDFNEDGWPDVYVANDFLEPDFLYINNQNGTFTDKILEIFDHIPANSMGSDVADINNDLKPDLITLDMLADDHQRSKENMATMSTENFNFLVNSGYHHQYMSNMLQLNLGAGVYSEIGQIAGIAKTDWSWAPLFADFNNDGFNDLFVTNGIQHDLSNQDFRNQMKNNIRKRKKVTLEQAIQMMPSTKLQNRAFMNTGDYSFVQKSEAWGIDEKVNSNGVAYADLDNDGDLDLVVNNQADIATIYKNNQSNNFLSVDLKGTQSNPNSIGASATLYTRDNQQVKKVYPSRGFQSSVTYTLHFGLGKSTHVDSLLIQWGDGKVSKLEAIKANQHVTLSHAESKDNSIANSKDHLSAFSLHNGSEFGIHYENKEIPFNDYSKQLLLPQKQSEKGAVLTVADVNNDGKNDFFVGNGKGFAAALYIQNSSGKFELSSKNIFEEDKIYEDKKALFFDMDNDQDLDLYVASGSYEDEPDSPLLQDRIYENDGSGNFKRALALPEIHTNSNAIAASDIDQDGDIDLFIGGDVIPGQYPVSYSSLILLNNNGSFAKMNPENMSNFDTLRIVNDAIFSDYDLDGDQDLFVVGEWMAVHIFENKNGSFEASDIPQLAQNKGWYFKIHPSDFDNDGDTDYLIGNLGENNKFKPSPNKPLHIYAKDFDANSSFDIILSKKSKNGLLVPVRGKECSSEQVPKLSQQFKTYKEFASASIIDMYGKEDLNEAIHYTATTLSSMLLINKGNGAFDIQNLPKVAQFGPTTDFLTADFNNDGSIDIFGIGSLYEAEVETIRYDAAKGYFLFGNQVKNQISLSFKLPNILHGLQLKAMELIEINGNEYIILLIKKEQLKFLKLNFHNENPDI